MTPSRGWYLWRGLIGKDFVAGFIALWFFLTRNPVRVVTTSVDATQLEGVLWGEIRRFIQTSKIPLDSSKGGPLVVNHLHLRKMVKETGSMCGISYMIGRVAAKGEGMLGHHVANQGDGIPRTLFVSDEACHDQETEVLTDKGWKHFKELDGTELLLSMDPRTRYATYQKPVSIHHSEYKGEMCLYERRGGNFCVTPNHRMLWSKRRSKCAKPWSEYYFQQIQYINGSCRKIPRCFNWQGEEREYFDLKYKITERKIYHRLRLKMDTWLEFLGWYFSEGNLMFINKIPYSIRISQKDIDVLHYINKLAGQLGFSGHIQSKCQSPGVTINERRLAEYMMSHGRYSWEKRIPEFIGELSPRQIEIFLKAYTQGDGYQHNNRDIIYTSSPQIADELQILSYKCGRASTVMMRKLIGLPAPHGVSRRDGFVVSRVEPGTDSHIRIRREHIQKIHYEGMVSCANVPPHHTLFTRRKGVCMWSGNSGVEDVSYERAETWANRKLIIGNPYPCNNYFYRGVKAGDLLAPPGR